MSQTHQFPADLQAPHLWASEVEGRTAGEARWLDSSYGEDAAPSWSLVSELGTVLARASFYAPGNTERASSRFGKLAYVSLSLQDDNDVVAAFTMSPEAFIAVIESAQNQLDAEPRAALQVALDATGRSHPIYREAVP